MNAPEYQPSPSLDIVEDNCIAALNRFDLEEFQHLSQADLLLAQSVLGHGHRWGIWETSKTINPGKLNSSFRAIDLAKRLRAFLNKEPVPQASLDDLVAEGVLTLVRIALLLRLAPTSGQRVSKNRRLKPSSIAKRLYMEGPQILSRAILRKAKRPDTQGLYACLTQEDVGELIQGKRIRIEIERLDALGSRGWWTDLPPQQDMTRTTNPRGPKGVLLPEEIAGEYQPIPDAYLAEIGPRILWLIRDLGPNLLSMLESLAACLESLDWSAMTRDKLIGDYGVVNKFIATNLREFPWKDYQGKPLKPAFPLTTGATSADKFEWPPRNYQQLRILSVTLQSAHLFIALLASAGRIGEVETLTRSCVTIARDGKDYLKGWTYKLSGNLFGDARQWPAPTVLVQAVGQQLRLANVWFRLPAGTIEDGLPTIPPAHSGLWVSLGPRTSASKPLGKCEGALKMLAERVGMNPRPGGINLHAHRFRKTIGRLAGVALFNSPLVLKRLFGHKSIEMTLRYILCDEDVRTQAETVLRELRILHCAEALEEVREALAKGIPLPGHSGAPAARMVEAVKDHEARLAKSSRIWEDGSAYELAYLMTAAGQGWRFIQKNIVCTKVPGEDGLCRKKRKRGEPDTSNCKTECSNRIVLALERRDAEEVLDSYLDIARQARDDEQYLVFYEAMQRFAEELDAFQDIKARYSADPEVNSLLTACQELTQ